MDQGRGHGKWKMVSDPAPTGRRQSNRSGRSDQDFPLGVSQGDRNLQSWGGMEETRGSRQVVALVPEAASASERRRLLRRLLQYALHLPVQHERVSYLSARRG